MPNTPPNLASLEVALNVKFKDRSLLQQALVHGSYLNEHPEEQLEDYERLEFLGDAFLGWVIADELYTRYRGFAEGDLTRARASLVRGTTLAQIGRSLQLGDRIVMGSGEEATGGRDRRSNLAAVVEALLGAVLIDQGQEAARRLVLEWLGAELDSLDPSGAPRDAKSTLQELCQREGRHLPHYELVSDDGPAHAKHFIVRVIVDGEPMGTGEGKRKADAEQAAAAMALAAMHPESSPSSRT